LACIFEIIHNCIANPQKSGWLWGWYVVFVVVVVVVGGDGDGCGSLYYCGSAA